MPYKNKADQAAASKRWYEANKDLCKKRARTHTDKVRESNTEYLNKVKDVPCMDCGIKYPPYVMDFDHRDPTDKVINIANAKFWSRKRLQSEVDKCDVVCSNCHRERTHSGSAVQICPPLPITECYDSG